LGIIHISHIALITPLHYVNAVSSSFWRVGHMVHYAVNFVPQWPKSGGSKNFLLASLAEFVAPTFKTVAPPLMTHYAGYDPASSLDIKHSESFW